MLLKRDIDAFSRRLSEIMSTKLIVCSPKDEIDNVWRMMQKRSIAGLPVIKKGKLVGIITQKDLLDRGAVRPSFEAKKGRFKAPPKVSSVMKTPVISLRPTDTIRDATTLILEKNIGRLPIVDEKGRLVGIVTVMDVLRFFGSGQVFEHLQSGTITHVLRTPILEIAVKEVVTVGPDADVGQAAELMRKRRVGALPVVEKEKLVGIITERDLFKLIA